jgi:O-antigen ligase
MPELHSRIAPTAHDDPRTLIVPSSFQRTICWRDAYCLGSFLAVIAYAPLVSASFAVFAVALSAVGGILLVHIALRKNSRVLTTALSSGAPVYLGVLWALASSAWSIAPTETLRSGAILIPFLTLLFMAQSVREDRKPQFASMLALLWVVCAAAFASYLLFRFGSVRSYNAEMVNAVGGQWGNRLSNALAVSTPLVWYGLDAGLLSKRAFLAALLLSSAVAVLSVSRGGIAVYAFANLLCILLVARRKSLLRRKYFHSLALAALLLTLAGTLLAFISDTPSEILERFINTDVESVLSGTEADRAEGDYTRRMQYAVGWQLVRNSSPLGIGYYGFQTHMERHAPVSTTAHNVLFIAIGELGWVGGLILIFVSLQLVASLLRKLRKSVSVNRLLYQYLAISIAIGALSFLWRPQQDNPILWICVGLLLGRRWGSPQVSG